MTDSPSADAVAFLNVDVEVYGSVDRTALERGFAPAAFVLHQNEEVVAFELNDCRALTLNDVINRFIESVRSLAPDARKAWNDAAKRVFDIGIRSGQVPHSSTWMLPPTILRDLAEIEAEVRMTVYGNAMFQEQKSR